MNKKYIYLSHFLTQNTPTYGNRDKFSIKENSSISKGDTANSFSISFSTNHLGTHIDLPKHFYDDGKTLNDFEPSYWFYSTISIVDIPKNKGELIIPKDFFNLQINKESDILLIRTGFEKYRNEKIYWEENPGIDPSVSDYLRNEYTNVRTIGFDFISLTSFQHRDLGKVAHRKFLSEEEKFITIIEDMKLSKIKINPKSLLVIPLLIANIDAAPVTIIAQT